MINEEASVADIALDIVENTRRNVFLTGEAGTGKTTFLRTFLQRTEKKCVVVAPTGVAAINAGGSTIHSMFGLPTRMFLPTMQSVDPNVAQNIPMLQTHFHYPKPKLDIFKNLDLLIIDEISMVRCDLFDAIDESLRFSRRSPLPFGGVQLLLIGDLYQLPPVVRNHEKDVLFEYYKSEFFFDSHCYPSLEIIQLKLNKVYRQSNKAFIGLLNNIRNATLEDGDFETLQERYQPEFEPDEDGFVTLCSHNATADKINQEKLQALQGDEFSYFADVSGDFFESQYPIEMKLTLKVGAQVMFVKNDVSGERKYFNGKIAIVTELREDQIFVEDPVNGKLIEVERDVWQHLKYQYDSSNDQVSQEEVGSFKHFPLKLAWAITIHKSQGLTLEKVIIDAERSFAPGQVYVALSRAVSLDGLYLKSGITGRNIFLDPKIVEYSEGNLPVQELPEILELEKRLFGKQKLISKFEFDKTRSSTSAWFNKLDRKHGADLPQELVDIYHRHLQINNDLEKIMVKFRNEIDFIFETLKTENDLLDELMNRGGKAIRYCAQRMDQDMIIPTLKWVSHYQKKPRSKRWFNALNELMEITYQKRDQILKISYNNQRLHPDDVSRPVIQD